MKRAAALFLIGGCVAFAAGCRAADPNAVIRGDSRVFMEYSLSAGSQPLIEANRPEKAEFRMGGGVFPAKVERALLGRKRNERLTLALAPAEAFGEIRPDYRYRIPLTMVPKNAEVKEGTWLTAKDPRTGEPAAFRIIKVLDDSIIMDRNHPLAGMPLEYRIKIIRVD